MRGSAVERRGGLPADAVTLLQVKGQVGNNAAPVCVRLCRLHTHKFPLFCQVCCDLRASGSAAACF